MTAKEKVELRDIIRDTIKFGVDNLESTGEMFIRVVEDARKGVSDSLKSATDSVDDVVSQARKANKDNADWLRKQALNVVSALPLGKHRAKSSEK